MKKNDFIKFILNFQSSEYLLSLIGLAGLAFLLPPREFTLAIGVIGNSYVIGRTIFKRGQDMSYTGFRTREFQATAAQVAWGLYALASGAVSPDLAGGLVALAVGVYNLGRGFTKGRVIRGSTQVIRI